jgi:hypothetical protein
MGIAEGGEYGGGGGVGEGNWELGIGNCWRLGESPVGCGVFCLCAGGEPKHDGEAGFEGGGFGGGEGGEAGEVLVHEIGEVPGVFVSVGLGVGVGCDLGAGVRISHCSISRHILVQKTTF